MEELFDLVVQVLLPEARRAGKCQLVARYIRSILYPIFTQMFMEKYVPLKYTVFEIHGSLRKKN